MLWTVGHRPKKKFLSSHRLMWFTVDITHSTGEAESTWKGLRCLSRGIRKEFLERWVRFHIQRFDPELGWVLTAPSLSLFFSCKVQLFPIQYSGVLSVYFTHIMPVTQTPGLSRRCLLCASWAGYEDTVLSEWDEVPFSWKLLSRKQGRS